MTKPSLTNFVWSEPKTLKQVIKNDSLVSLIFDDNTKVKMSRKKYRDAADDVFNKATALKGQQIVYRTSQNTGDWSSDQWFSDIKAV